MLIDALNYPSSYAKTTPELKGFFKELVAIAEPPTMVSSASEFGDAIIEVTEKIWSMASSDFELITGLSYLAIYRGSAEYWSDQISSSEAPWNGFFPNTATFAAARNVARKDAYGAIYGAIGGGISGAIGGAITGAITGPGVIIAAGTGFAAGFLGGLVGGAATASLAAVAEKQEKEK